MATTLTRDDLHAIKELVDGSIDEHVPIIIERIVPPMIDARVQPMLDGLESRLIKRIDELDDRLAQQVEHGLQEVRDQVADVQQTIGRMEQTQRAEIVRVDRQDSTIKQIRKTLRAV